MFLTYYRFPLSYLDISFNICVYSVRGQANTLKTFTQYMVAPEILYFKFHLHVHQREFFLIVSRRESKPVLNIFLSLPVQFSSYIFTKQVTYWAYCLPSLCQLTSDDRYWSVKSVESNKSQFQWFLAHLSLSICHRYTKRLCLLNWN